MTVVVGDSGGGGGNVPSGSQLHDITTLSATSHSSTEIDFDLGGGQSVAIIGTGFSGFNGNGIPSSGTATELSTPGSDWSGFGVPFTTLWTDMQNGDVAAVDATLFSGNDTFISHNQSLTKGEVYEGFDGNDTFDMTDAKSGTEAHLKGDAGSDTFIFGGNFSTVTSPHSSADQIDGGTGKDTLVLNGDYSSGLTFSAGSLKNVETISLTVGQSYALTTNDATVASGKTLTVNGSALGSSNTLTFNGAAETNGKFVIRGGHGADLLEGGNKADTLTGGKGADHFIYASPSQSTGASYDTIKDFNASQDKIDVPGTIGTITGIDTAVVTGALSTSSFDADLASAIGSTQLAAHHAVEFTPSSGGLHGDHFLIVDTNGVAGYQANADLVILLGSHSSNLTHLDPGDFI